MIDLALYQPDIPQNTGAAMRLCACLGAGLHIIEPCGFLWDERRIKRSALDYSDQLSLIRHPSWDAFQTARGQNNPGRIILMTTSGDRAYTDYSFAPGDIIMMGRESAGVPDNVHHAADARLIIPMHGTARSLNVINAAAMVLGEARRQLKEETKG